MMAERSDRPHATAPQIPAMAREGRLRPSTATFGRRVTPKAAFRTLDSLCGNPDGSMIPAMIQMSSGSEAEKRRAERRRVRLAGRYLLVDRTEWVCQTIDISPTGVLLAGQARPYQDQTVIAYLDEVGRLEGTVVRMDNGAFALSIHATDRKREQLADALARLAEGAAVPRLIDPAILAAIERATPDPVTQTSPVAPTPAPRLKTSAAYRRYLDHM